METKDPGGNKIMTRNYEFDLLGNITSIQSEYGNYTFAYDDHQRLSTVDNPIIANTAFPDEAYTYDVMGNRLTQAGVEGNAVYDNNNSLLSFGSMISYEYNSNGSTTKRIINGEEHRFVYNLEGRLSKVTDSNGGLIAEYYYDPFGHRLWKDVAGNRTYFMYADEGLIAEFNGNGEQTKGYGYIPDSTWGSNPQWMKDGDEYYFYHNDQIGTPQKLTNIGGAVVWTALYTSFGDAIIEKQIIVNNLRFPGQYFDQETGLHYNNLRNYDPTIGRYIETDPIGLNGGINTYLYANSNPLRFVDPLGLKVIGSYGSRPTLSSDGGFRRDSNHCSGRKFADCYFKPADFGFTIDFFFWASVIVSWSVDCEDTETCEKWTVPRRYGEFEDFTVRNTNPAVCGFLQGLPSRAVLRPSGRQPIQDFCSPVPFGNVYKKYKQVADKLVADGLEYKNANDNLTSGQLSAICVAGRP